MTITEFRRLCVNGERRIRVAGTDCWIGISSREAENVFQHVSGRIAVDYQSDRAAHIRVLPAPEGSL